MARRRGEIYPHALHMAESEAMGRPNYNSHRPKTYLSFQGGPVKTFQDFGIDVKGQTGLEVSTTCPQCSPHRRKKHVKCLSANTEKGLWFCHHCGWRGSLKTGIENTGDGFLRRTPNFTRPSYQYDEQGLDRLEAWFKERAIPREVVVRNKIRLGRVYIPHEEDFGEAIQFPYFRGDEVVNIKSRTLAGKNFVQVKGAEKILYGLNDLQEDWAIIVEGEVDKLSLEVAGFTNVVSVPDGAPSEGSNPSDRKFDYLANCAEFLDPLSKIVLAVDNDGPGRTLASELAKRLGPERCWRVQWPQPAKDANDVLLHHGTQALAACIDQATPLPLEGVFEVASLADDVLNLYREGVLGGVSTGWKTLDEFYTVKPGEVTIVTGIPGHGKSEWLDHLIINLAVISGWFILLCSPENSPPQRHLAKLIEKYTGKPFQSGPTFPLTPHQIVTALSWLNSHVAIMLPSDDKLTIPDLLTLAKQTIPRYGIDGFVLDPWNEFDHSRPTSMTETEYISDCLTKIRRFARKYHVHVWLVAHPMKPKRREDGTYPVPTPYDISGSAHWRNKADNCLTIWRDLLDESGRVEIHVQKIRFREVGRPGMTPLYWNSLNGRYEEHHGNHSTDT